jgi:hypothetical protein
LVSAATPRVSRINSEWLSVTVPDASDKSGVRTITVVLSREWETILYQKLAEDLDNWEVTDILPDGTPHNMHYETPTHNRELNIGQH